MRPIIFCGFRHRGKTTFIKRVIEAVKGEGYKVSVIKHVGGGLKLEDRDTARFIDSGADVSIGYGDTLITTYERSEGFTGKIELRGVLHELIVKSKGDFVLIEGFKSYSGPIPRIVFGNSKEEILSIADRMTVGYTGIGAGDYKINIPYIPFNLEGKELFKVIKKLSVPFVADLDCGECGYPDCMDFTLAMLSGKESIKKCVPMQGEVLLRLNGKPVYLKGFVRDILRGVIEGFVSNLHGYEEGDVQIYIRKIREKDREVGI